MAKAKSRAVLETENRMLRRARTAESVAAVVQTGIRWIGAGVIAFYCYRSVQVLAGRTTLAQIGIGFLADVKVSEALAWLLAVLFGGYGWSQRNLRKDTIERLQDRIRQLETAHDPNRTSSKLATRGDTRPEDRL